MVSMTRLHSALETLQEIRSEYFDIPQGYSLRAGLARKLFSEHGSFDLHMKVGKVHKDTEKDGRLTW